MPATASFRGFHVERIAADVKETLCRFSETRYDENENKNIPNVAYEVGGVDGRCGGPAGGSTGEARQPPGGEGLEAQGGVAASVLLVTRASCCPAASRRHRDPRGAGQVQDPGAAVPTGEHARLCCMELCALGGGVGRAGTEHTAGGSVSPPLPGVVLARASVQNLIKTYDGVAEAAGLSEASMLSVPGA